MKFAIDAFQMEKVKKSKKRAENLFAKAWENSDTVLVVERKELHVHSLIISFHSSVLKEKLEACKYQLVKRIELEEVAHQQIAILLAMMYPQYGVNLCKLYAAVQSLLNQVEILFQFRVIRFSFCFIMAEQIPSSTVT